ncbi:MAG: DUF370 domain-containing protein [Clostridiales bacterium]|nr:DUF370 domain-containing protein [Clostridiales bacterium]
MYLHLGQDVLVRKRDVIGIFDIETTTVERSTRDFLARAERESRVTTLTSELPRSFVLTQEQGVLRVYIGQIATATLRRRMENDMA